MKKFIFIHIISCIALFSCEDVIDIDLPEAPPRLVIDASVERQFSAEGDFEKDEALVNLSLTTPFFEEEKSVVNEAQVTLTNTVTEEVFALQNIGRGDYRITATDFSIEDNVAYKLTVVYNQETYESTESISFSSPLTKIEQVNNPDIFEGGIAAEIAFNDLAGQENFYFLDLGDANISDVDDEFFKDGEEIKLTYFFEENSSLQRVFKIYGSTKRFNTFIDAITQLSSGDSNGPFATVPFKARGNIVNVSNKDNFPFGYFRVNEVYSFPVEFLSSEEFEMRSNQ